MTRPIRTLTMKTRIVRIADVPLGGFTGAQGAARLESFATDPSSEAEIAKLREAARYLIENDTPVAFPTETVYGLGADARRSGAVKGIYAAKGRPSDNPLIVHVCDLQMLRDLLPAPSAGAQDPIPEIYKPLIERFWPGPLTILLPAPRPSKLAAEVTAGLPTFGVRMPDSSLALALIKLSGAPLAAPSANASTKPSPTTARHVLEDLDGRIELILDGGPCSVGVESTVVDGLCDPPVVLRPGGVSMEELRGCPGWEGAVKGYKDQSEVGKDAPRAPGMKYKHYSPKAKVVLYEASFAGGADGVVESDRTDVPAAGAVNGNAAGRTVGVVRTKRWKQAGGFRCGELAATADIVEDIEEVNGTVASTSFEVAEGDLTDESGKAIGRILDIDLGKDSRGIARGLFSSLRELDRRGADIIYVDGVEDSADIAGAVMNRLRKAATEIRS